MIDDDIDIHGEGEKTLEGKLLLMYIAIVY